jgi:hypothetical protein
MAYEAMSGAVERRCGRSVPDDDARRLFGHGGPEQAPEGLLFLLARGIDPRDADGSGHEPDRRRGPGALDRAFDGGLRLFAVQPRELVLSRAGDRPRQGRAQHDDIVDRGHERRDDRGTARE